MQKISTTSFKPWKAPPYINLSQKLSPSEVDALFALRLQLYRKCGVPLPVTTSAASAQQIILANKNRLVLKLCGNMVRCSLHTPQGQVLLQGQREVYCLPEQLHLVWRQAAAQRLYEACLASFGTFQHI